MMRMNEHFGTLVLFIACYGSFSGVEGGVGCQEPVCPPGDGRCKTEADEGRLTVTISGKIASAESSCQAPLANEEIRLYTGCARSKDFNVEPAAGWKTGKDGTFEVSVPFKPGTGLLRTELCLTPGRRGCQPLTLNIPPQKNPPHPGVRYAVAGATTSILAAGGQGVIGEVKDGDKVIRVNLCLGEKRRRRRLAGWDDRDMSWLRKKSTEKRQDPVAGKRGWSNGIPWLKRPHQSPASFRRTSEPEKRLWEGADDEVGWIKRHSMGDDGEERPGEENLPPNDEDDMTAADYVDDGVPNDGQPGKRRSAAAGAAAAAKETAQSGLAAAGHGSRRPPEAVKKYWAQSDMSWL